MPRSASRRAGRGGRARATSVQSAPAERENRRARSVVTDTPAPYAPLPRRAMSAKPAAEVRQRATPLSREVLPVATAIVDTRVGAPAHGGGIDGAEDGDQREKGDHAYMIVFVRSRR